MTAIDVRSGDLDREAAPTSSFGVLGVAAVASICAGAIHATAVGTHSSQRQVVYTFAAVAVFQIAWGVVALTRPTRLIGVVGLVGNGLCVGGWLMAKSFGISFIDGFEEAESIQLADVLAVAFAVLAAVGSFAWLARIHVRVGPPRVRSALATAAVVPLAVLAVTGMIATGDHGLGGGGHHAAPAVIPPQAFDPQAVDLSGVEGVSAEQEARAEQLVTDTVRVLPQFADTAAAEAAGFRSIGDGGTGTEHYINWDYIDDGHILDPNYPESVMYRVDGSERILEAAMFMLPTGETLDSVPDIGGPLTQWHIHDNLCFTDDPEAPQVAGVTSSGGPCPAPLVRLASVPMIHVWIVANPCGPFAALQGIGGGQIDEGATRLCDTTNADEAPFF